MLPQPESRRSSQEPLEQGYIFLQDKRLREQLGLGSGKAWEDEGAGEGGACEEEDMAVGPRDWKPPAPLQQSLSKEP